MALFGSTKTKKIVAIGLVMRAPWPVLRGKTFPEDICPEHFKTDSGVPGVLYLARNDEYREHLYRIGFTSGLPQGRIKELKEEAAKAVDTGSFRLIHSVPVGSTYDFKHALYAALAERRIVDEREYFYGPEQFFVQAMDALALMPQDEGEAINDFVVEDPWHTSPGPPPEIRNACPIPAQCPPGGGWLYVCENYWHRPGTFFFSVSREEPGALVKRLNKAQRKLSSQIGAYRIVACCTIASTGMGLASAQRSFAPYRIDFRRKFIRSSLEVARSIVESLDAGNADAAT